MLTNRPRRRCRDDHRRAGRRTGCGYHRRAWQQILDITAKLHAITDVELRLANAANYLEAFGHMIVGWLWLDQAVVLHKKLENSTSPDFIYGKLAACDYFFGWEMPKINSWLAVLDPVEATPLNMHQSWF